MTAAEVMTLEDARAVAAILRAAETGALVARLNGVRVLAGRARYIGGPPLMRPNWTAERKADVRDLYLHAVNTAYRDHQPLRPESAYRIAHFSWLIRDLVAEYRTGAFVTDFDREAFEAAGEQAAVPAVAAYETASARPKPGSKPDFWQDTLARTGLSPDQIAAMIRPGLIESAREWIADCQWANDFDADELTPGQVYAGIARHYPGGWAQFRQDNS